VPFVIFFAVAFLIGTGSVYYHALTIHILSEIRRCLDAGDNATTSLSTTERSIASAVEEIANVLKIHQSTWGLSRLSALNIQPIDIAMRGLLKHASVAQDMQPAKMLYLAQKALSSRWKSAQTLLEAHHIPRYSLSTESV
jgi:hypothetical protein